MFLTRGPMPLEPIWREFLEGDPAGGGVHWSELFALHTHPAPGYEYPPASIFHGTEVAGRRRVVWGEHSVVTAERALIRAALVSPSTMRFLLASETCVPLWSRATLYLNLMSRQRSEINTCRDLKSKQEAQQHMAFR